MEDEYVEAERLAAELLRKARRERGLTQVDVADELAQRGFRLSLAESHAPMDVLRLNEGTAYQRIKPL